jgi:CRISPR/Cas system-associated endonuclease/helicase Cas3
VNGAPSENENEFLDEKVIAILNGRVILDEVDILDEDVNLEMST